MLQRASGALQPGRCRRYRVLRCGDRQGQFAQREKGGRQAQSLIAGRRQYPRRWRRIISIPNPGSTISILSESNRVSLWSSRVGVDGRRSK